MDSRTSDKKTKKRHVLRNFLIILALLVLIVLVAVPMYLSSGAGKGMILGRINSSIDGRVEMDDFSFGWLGGIKVAGLDYNDTAGLTRITVDRISANPSYLSFLAGRADIGKTRIEKPKVYIKLDPAGAEISQHSTEKPDQHRSASGAALMKMDLTVDDGDIMIETSAGKTVQFANLAAKVNLNGINRKNVFDVSVGVADSGGDNRGTLKTSGTVTPKVENGKWSLAGTSGDFKVVVDRLDLAQLGPLFEAMGTNAQAAGVVDVNMNVVLDKGRFDNVEGRVYGRDVNVLLPGATGDRIISSEIRGDVKVVGSKNAYDFQRLDVVSDWLVVNGSGSIGKEGGDKGSFEAGFSFDIAAAAKAMPKTFSVREGVEITGGTLSGNVFSVTSEKTRDFIVKASLDGLKAVSNGKEVVLSQAIGMEVDAAHSGDKWEVNNAQMTSGFANIVCSGGLDGLKYTVNSDLSALQGELGSFFDLGGYTFAGRLGQEGVVRFVGDVIANEGKAVLNDLVIQKDKREAKEPAAEIEFDLSMDKKSNVLEIADLKYNGSAGKFEIDKSSVYTGEGSGDTKLNISVDADLGRLMSFAVMSGAVSPEYGLMGKADIDASIAKSGDIVTVKTSGGRIENPKISFNDKAMFDQKFTELDFDGRFNLASKSITINSMKLISPQIKIIKASITRKEVGKNELLQGNIEYDVNLVSVGEVVDPFLPEGFELYGNEQGVLQFDSEYPIDHPELMLDHLNAKTTFGFDKANYMGLHFGKTEIDIAIDDGFMQIKPFQTVVNDGTLSFAANADFGKRPVMLTMPEPMLILDRVHIDREMSNKLLQYLNPLFARLTDVKGLLSFNCNRLAIPLDEGNGKNIVIDGTVSMDDVYISGGGFVSQLSKVTNVHNPNIGIKILPTNFVFEDGVMHYDNMQVNFGDKPVNFTGNVYVDKVMSMTVTLPWKLGSAGSRIKLPIRGPVTEPKLEVDKALEETGRELIKEQLDKALEDLFKD